MVHVIGNATAMMPVPEEVHAKLREEGENFYDGVSQFLEQRGSQPLSTSVYAGQPGGRYTNRKPYKRYNANGGVYRNIANGYKGNNGRSYAANAPSMTKSSVAPPKAVALNAEAKSFVAPSKAAPVNNAEAKPFGPAKHASGHYAAGLATPEEFMASAREYLKPTAGTPNTASGVKTETKSFVAPPKVAPVVNGEVKTFVAPKLNPIAHTKAKSAAPATRPPAGNSGLASNDEFMASAREHLKLTAGTSNTASGVKTKTQSVVAPPKTVHVAETEVKSPIPSPKATPVATEVKSFVAPKPTPIVHTKIKSAVPATRPSASNSGLEKTAWANWGLSIAEHDRQTERARQNFIANQGKENPFRVETIWKPRRSKTAEQPTTGIAPGPAKTENVTPQTVHVAKTEVKSPVDAPKATPVATEVKSFVAPKLTPIIHTKGKSAVSATRPSARNSGLENVAKTAWGNWELIIADQDRQTAERARQNFIVNQGKENPFRLKTYCKPRRSNVSIEAKPAASTPAARVNTEVPEHAAGITTGDDKSGIDSVSETVSNADNNSRPIARVPSAKTAWDNWELIIAEQDRQTAERARQNFIVNQGKENPFRLKTYCKPRRSNVSIEAKPAASTPAARVNTEVSEHAAGITTGDDKTGIDSVSETVSNIGIETKPAAGTGDTIVTVANTEVPLNAASGVNPEAKPFVPAARSSAGNAGLVSGDQFMASARKFLAGGGLGSDKYRKSATTSGASSPGIKPREAPARALLFKNVPDWLNIPDVLGFVYGGAIDCIFRSNMAEITVKFCDEAACMAYLNAHPNGIRVRNPGQPDETVIIDVEKAPRGEEVSPALQMKVATGSSRLVRVDGTFDTEKLQALTARAMEYELDHMMLRTEKNKMGSVYIFFCSLADGWDFKQKLQEDEAWSEFVALFMADPCKVATAFHDNTIPNRMASAVAV